MIAIDATAGNSSELVPADLLQQQMLAMKLKRPNFAAVAANPIAVPIPTGKRDQPDGRNGLLYFEYLKGTFLLTFLFSMLVLAVYISGQF